MKKFVLVLAMVLTLSGTSFAWWDNNTGSNTGPNSGLQNTGTINGGIKDSFNTVDNSINNTATGGSATATGGNVTIGGGFFSKTLSPEANAEANVNNINVNAPSNKNVGINKQQQGQMQGQMQGQQQGQMMNNKQIIAPNQTVLFDSPTQLPNVTTGGGVPELNFGSGRMYDCTKQLPKFAIFGITPIKAEDMISEVLSVNANVKFKNLYKEILKDAKGLANGSKTLADVRIQIIKAEAQKSWHTGGSVGAGGTGVGPNGFAGGSGGGSIVPSFGGTKADDLFTIIFVRVAK